MKFLVGDFGLVKQGLQFLSQLAAIVGDVVTGARLVGP